MKRLLALSLFSIGLNVCLCAQQGWQIAGDKITTQWAKNVDPANTLPEYPRPQLVRNNWSNLNGLWQYAIVPKSQQTIPEMTQGNILVPFAVESALSGVARTVGKDSLLWYKKTIAIAAKKNSRTILHFGAVDWQTTVFVNGKEAGAHEGGYDPFSIDITAALKKGNKQEIAIRVWDPSDEGPQPRGKQVKNPEGIWYTPVTGIWQTVWIETVPVTYIVSTKQTPDTDNNKIIVSTAVENTQPGDELQIIVLDGATKISEVTAAVNTETAIKVPDAKIWSPENPFLYDLSYKLIRKGKVVDEVKSYFAMRKISMQADKNGIQRMMLNNQFVFQYGPLDQGWWPDGLYTAPTDEALQFDIDKTKEMGFTLIRKHVKVEPARWYYHCDKAGMLVWQDMPSGDMGGNAWDMRAGQVSGRKLDKDRSQASEAIYRKEWKAIMDALHNFPSIVAWVPFNEAWGQFKTKEITEWTEKMDPSRLVNSASGGNFFNTGHILDIHHYPDPQMPSPEVFGKTQALVLGEFGGLGLPVDGHTWQNKGNWGYQSFKTNDDLYTKYAEFVDQLPYLIGIGLSASIYTQTTDVEGEINGLMTYDRKEIKFSPGKLKALHKKLYEKSLVSFK